MEKYKYEKRYWYPHMGPRDAAIWQRFLDKYPDRFDYVQYDVPVGEGRAVPDGTAEDMAAMWKWLTKGRCDVVAFKDDMPTIVEVRPEAWFDVIGKIICYDLVYQEYVDKDARPALLVLTDVLRPDMDWLCVEFNIKIEVV